MLRTATVLLGCLTFCAAFDNKLSWCDYWYKRGIARSECTRPLQQHWSLVTKQPETERNILAMPICDLVTDWSRCQRSNHCPLGLLCWVRGNPCCTPQMNNNVGEVAGGQCPSQQTMGIQCSVRSAVNWCFVDSDCHRFNSLQKCCPSGCGYNVCVRASPIVDLPTRMAALVTVPSQCPRMDSLPISCTGTRGVSWCHSDNDCYSNGAMRRFCCPTTCGYNVCLLRLDDSRWIIA